MMFAPQCLDFNVDGRRGRPGAFVVRASVDGPLGRCLSGKAYDIKKAKLELDWLGMVIEQLCPMGVDNGNVIRP